MKRWVGALAFVAATALSSTALGQEIQIRGPLAGAPSCRRCVQYRVGRFSIAPSIGITLNDDFNRTVFAGAVLNYHIFDIFAVGAYAGFGVVNYPTQLTDAIATSLEQRTAMMDNSGSTPNIPVGGNAFRGQVGRMNWFIGAPQVTLIPLRGKLALFQNVFIDTDFYIFAAPAFIGVSERRNLRTPTSEPPVTRGDDMRAIANQGQQDARVAITGTFGVGLNFFFNRFLSLSIEYRAFPFAWNTMGTDENSLAQTCGARGTASCQGFGDYQVDPDAAGNGGQYIIDENDRQFRWNQMLNLSFNIFLPVAPRIAD